MPSIGGNATSRKNRKERLFLAQNGMCHWCGLKMTMTKQKDGRSSPLHATFEHIIPRSLGGKHGRENVVLAHLRCNTTRGAGNAIETYSAADAAKKIGF